MIVTAAVEIKIDKKIVNNFMEIRQVKIRFTLPSPS